MRAVSSEGQLPPQSRDAWKHFLSVDDLSSFRQLDQQRFAEFVRSMRSWRSKRAIDFASLLREHDQFVDCDLVTEIECAFEHMSIALGVHHRCVLGHSESAECA